MVVLASKDLKLATIFYLHWASINCEKLEYIRTMWEENMKTSTDNGVFR